MRPTISQVEIESVRRAVRELRNHPLPVHGEYSNESYVRDFIDKVDAICSAIERLQ